MERLSLPRRLWSAVRASVDFNQINAAASVVGLAATIVALLVKDATALAIFGIGAVAVFGFVVVASLIVQERSGGLFHVLSEEHEWAIETTDGRRATMTRRRRSRVLQDGIYSLRDFAWGTRGSHTSPVGHPYPVVHEYDSPPDGRRTALMLLDQVKRRMDELEHSVTWQVNEVFVDDMNYVESQPSNPTRTLVLRVIFPSGRNPTEVSYLPPHKPNQPEVLSLESMPDGRLKVEKLLRNPERHRNHRIAWTW